IKIEKKTIGGDGQFKFTHNFGGPELVLDTTGKPGNLADRTFQVAPGKYSIQEAVTEGWDLTKATCSSTKEGDASTPDNIDLQANETITCRFENTKKGSVTIIKNTVGGDGTFKYTGT